MGNETNGKSTPSIPKPNPPKAPLYKSRTTDNFEDGKYNIKNYSYPEDIMSDVYGKNYAIFYINVQIDSKLLNDKTVETVDDYAPRDRGQLIALNTNLYTTADGKASAGQKAAFVTANATGAAIQGGLIGGLLAGKKGAAAGAALNAAPDALMIGAAATQAATVTRAQKRLKTAIALHIPNQLAVRYSTNWGDEDTFGYQATAAGAEAIGKAMQGGGMKALGNDAASIVGAIGLKSDKQGAAASASMGLAANPKKEQIFKGVDYRTFQFDYQFFPRSPEEAQNVLNIIQEFKYHMHPEFKDTNNFLYIYPSEFDIFYYQNGQENLNIHRHTSCVLKELNINYTPNGMFTTFDNGMPTQINIQMTFVELGLMDKEKIKNGL